MTLKINKRILIIVNKFEQGGTFNAAINFSIGYKEQGYFPQIIYFKASKVRQDLKRLISKNKIALVNYRDVNSILKPGYIHIIGHDIDFTYIKKIKLKFPNAKIFESNIFGKKNSYDDLLDSSWQLNHWSNASYILSGGKKNFGILPLPVNNKYLLSFKKKFQKLKLRKKISLLKVSQKYDGKWSIQILDVFKKIHSYNNKIELVLVTPTKEITNKIKKMRPEIRKKIKVINKITNIEDIYKLYYQSNLFLHITQQGETFGYVFFEANIFDCNVFCLETPGADNGQVEVLREIFNKKNIFNNITTLITQTKEALKKKNKKFFVRRKIEKFSITNVCKKSINLMNIKKRNIIKTDKYLLINLVSNYYSDYNSIIKKIFIKIIIYIFSINSIIILRKLKRLNII